MANSSSLLNRSSSSSSSIPIMSPENKPEEEEDVAFNLKFTWPFSTPATPEAATSRIIKNIRYFGLYYAQFMWVVLFITLIPERKVSVVYMVIMKEITLMYLMLLWAFPCSRLLHKTIDKRIVSFLLLVTTAIELIVTHAVIHLVASLSGTIPVVLLHASFYKAKSPFKIQDTAGEELVQELVQQINRRTEESALDSV